ncbi:MAG TPA: PAS domain S-box protein [Atribacteraceae bacterium]|nr:PAS domain S-box protein [Atribacteraceae bacterium]
MTDKSHTIPLVRPSAINGSRFVRVLPVILLCILILVFIPSPALAKIDFATFFATTDQIMLFIDPDDGRIVDANLAAVRFYGYPRERLTTMFIQEINTLTPDQVAEERARAVREERNYFIFRHRLADGSLRTVEVFSRPYPINGDILLLSLIHDITPRRELEEALWHYQTRLEEMVAEQVNRLRAQEFSTRVLAYASGLLLLALLLILILFLRYRGVILNQKVRERTAELVQSEQEMRWLFKSMISAFAVHESVFDEKGRFVSFRFFYFNEAYEQILGVELEQLRGKTVQEVWPGTEEEWIKRYGEVVTTGLSQTFDLYHAPTEKSYHCKAYRPWETKERFCVIFEDITERIRSEERERYLKQVILAIRNVNQLIVRENDLHRLIQCACENLIETLGYSAAWITLLDPSGTVTDTAFSGAGEEITLLGQNLTQGELPECLRHALAQGEVWLCREPRTECPGGPVIHYNEGQAGMSVRLSFGERTYGALVVSVPFRYAEDAEALNLFKELADDLSFALHKIETAQALRISQERYRLLAENMPGVVYLCLNDPSWTMLYMNDYIEKITGYIRAEFLDQRVRYSDLCHPEDLAMLHRSIDESLAAGRSFSSVYRLRHRSGEYRWVEEFGDAIRESGTVRYLEGYVQDITERKKKEEHIRHLSFHDHLTDLYNRVFIEKEIRRLNDIGEIPLGVILCDLNGLKLVNDAFGHLEGDKLLKLCAWTLQLSCRSQDLIGRWGGDEFIALLPQGNETVLTEVTERIAYHSREASTDLMPFSLSLGWAVRTDVLQPIDELIAFAEERMYRCKLTESRSARSSIIASLERSLQESTQETQEHATRLRELAQRMGKALHLSSNEINDLELLARLHDIGKISIPRHILDKPLALTPQEWEVVKKHPEVGYRIALSSPDLHPIAEAILAHHEHWDGAGYPQGLRREEIPLLSRIASVLDAFDVMISGRPYKKPRQLSEALQELQRCAGSQFDPRVVEVFSGLMRT